MTCPVFASPTMRAATFTESPVDVTGGVHHRAVVAADVNPQRQSAQCLVHGELHRARRVQRAVGLAEVAHQPVAHARHDLAPVVGRGVLEQPHTR